MLLQVQLPLRQERLTRGQGLLGLRQCRVLLLQRRLGGHLRLLERCLPQSQRCFLHHLGQEGIALRFIFCSTQALPQAAKPAFQHGPHGIGRAPPHVLAHALNGGTLALQQHGIGRSPNILLLHATGGFGGDVRHGG